jgi:hypothetical protein
LAYKRTLATPVAGAAGAIAWHRDDLRPWFNAFNGAYAHVEDPQFGGEVSGSWHTAFQNAYNAVDQSLADDGQFGGTVLLGPRRYGFTAEVECGSRYGIGFLGSSVGRSAVDESRGYGSAVYAKTASMRLFDCDASAGAVNHWGPLFQNMTFSGVDHKTTATLVRILNTNRWGFINCSFIWGQDQLYVDFDATPGGAPGSTDASYGFMAFCDFWNYNQRGLRLLGGQGKFYGLNFFQGVAGSWAIETGGYVANAVFEGMKLDTDPGNGIWSKGYANTFSDIGIEGATVCLRIDKDAGVAFAGHDNVFREIHCTGRDSGDFGIDITSTAGVNRIDGFYHQGYTGTQFFADASGGKWWGSGMFTDSEAPIFKLPNRTSHPSTPVGGAYLYAIGGELWAKDTAAQQVQQT